jgi:hypothetical protein
MRNSALCVLALVAGFAMMLASYFALQSPERKARDLKAAQSKAAFGDDTSSYEGTTRSVEDSLAPETRVPAGAFQLYLGGLALLLAGGSGLFVGLYRWLSTHLPAGRLREPLDAIRRYTMLLVLVHVGFFGLMLLSMEAGSAAPGIQRKLLTTVKQEIRNGTGPLHAAGSAYLSRSIPRAALVTVTVNFLLGSGVSITLPSIIVPGAGVLLAAVRSAMWGLILAPTHTSLSRAMLPHSFTLLMEGEGYILATFFGLLIPIYLLNATEGPTAGGRYGKAVLLNATGSFWIFVVLAVSAIYEATEVIIMKG